MLLRNPSCVKRPKGTRIRFTILSIGDAITAVINSRPCGCKKVRHEESGTVEVVDVLGLHLAPGAQGFARLMSTGIGDDCRWEIISLTCI